MLNIPVQSPLELPLLVAKAEKPSAVPVLLSPCDSTYFLQSQNGDPIFILQSGDWDHQANTFSGRILNTVFVFLLKTAKVSRKKCVYCN